jgi:hypothetical protein
VNPDISDSIKIITNAAVKDGAPPEMAAAIGSLVGQMFSNIASIAVSLDLLARAPATGNPPKA